MGYLKIGEVAKQTGVGIETIRFYERKGLLDEPARRPSGFRQYDASILARLQFIRRAKDLGFTLGEIAELLALWFDADTHCCDVRSKALAKIDEIEHKVQALQAMKRSLKQMVETCREHGSIEDCPLWDSLKHEHQLTTGYRGEP